MKITITALTLAIIIRRSEAACPSEIDLGSSCDVATVTSKLPADCTIQELFPDGDQDTAIPNICKYVAPTQFVELQGTYQLDQNYVNGGGAPTDGEDSFEMAMARVSRFVNNPTDGMNNNRISWPEYVQKEKYNAANGYGENGYMINFNIDRDAPEGSCKMNTAMCCFTESAKDALPDNSDICRHDLSTSPQSNHVKSGWSVFAGDEAAHCVGFTWKEGDSSDENKGNALFYASLYQTAKHGFMGNVPGAPMCACLEQMPVVSNAACIKADDNGTMNYKLLFDAVTGEVSATHTVNMSYGACDEADLSTHVKTVHAGTSIATDIDNYLVGEGNCENTNAEYLNDYQMLLPTDSQTSKFRSLDGAVEDGIEWAQVFGEGVDFLPPMVDPAEADEDMRTRMEACLSTLGRYCMVRRLCGSCTSEPHKDIIYQRHTALPDYQEGMSTDTTMDIPNLFMNQWRKQNNEMHIDYDLYSSVSDALNGVEAWEKSDYNNEDQNFGFPRNSGPKYHTWNQWNSYKWGGGHANHHGFYVEVPAAQ